MRFDYLAECLDAPVEMHVGNCHHRVARPGRPIAGDVIELVLDDAGVVTGHERLG